MEAVTAILQVIVIITKERIWKNLNKIQKDSAPGVDEQTVMEAKESFGEWIEPMLRAVHTQGYQAPDIRRVYIPKPGKQEKRPLGVPCYCTRNLKGNFKVGLRTEKSRLRRSYMQLKDRMRQMRHWSISEQVDSLNKALRGHYAYYGIAGNFRALQKVHRFVERYWYKMLCSRSWKSGMTWKRLHKIKEVFPLLRPKLYLPYRELQAIAVL